MAHPSERWPETAMALEIVQVLKDDLEFDTAASRIEEIELRYVAAAEGEDCLVLQQVAARLALIAATDLGASFQDVSARFHRICEIGFSSPHSEILVLIEFADVCCSFGHREEGLRVLAQASGRLPESGLKLQSAVSVVIEGCRKRLEGGEVTETE